jgi:hypothetical protein
MMSEMQKLDLATLPRETLIATIRVLSSCFSTVDGLWFRDAEDRLGLEQAIEIDKKVWERLGAAMARRIKREFQITESGLPALAQALHLQTLLWPTDYEILKPAGDKLIYNTIDCKPQRARVRDSMGELPCKEVGLALYEAFAKVIDPGIKVNCLVCPPDEHPEDLWCSWEFNLE